MSYKYLIFVFCILLSFNAKTQTAIDDIENDLQFGSYKLVIKKTEKRLKSETDQNIRFQLFELKAEAHLNLGQLPDYLISIKQSGKHNPCNKTRDIFFNTHLAEYYQHMLMPDSAIHFAQLSLNEVRDIGYDYDSTLTAYVYSNYANAMRNGGGYNKIIANTQNDFELRNQFLKAYLDTALRYSTSDKQKANIFLKIGTMYSDISAFYMKTPSEKIKEASSLSVKYLNRAIELEKSPGRKAMGFALIGLNQFYIGEYDKAEKTYQDALKLVHNENEILNSNVYITICNWRGANLEKWYEFSGSLTHLKSVNKVYKDGLIEWLKIVRSNKSNLGLHDAYHTSTANPLVGNSIDLYRLTNQESYLEEAFKFADLTKYPNFYTNEISIKQVQKQLRSNTAFVHYTAIARPLWHIAFIITKDNIELVEMPAAHLPPDTERLRFLYNFSDLNEFKRISNEFYNGYFCKVDSILTKKNLKNIIISNSDMCSMLNLDLLISDTLSKTWKSQPYLFHRYNFSYALSARSFIHSYLKPNKNGSFGITTGEYLKESNLRFSQQLTDNLSSAYASDICGIRVNLKSNSTSLLLSHGISGYQNQQAQIKTSSNDNLSVSEIFEMNLNNDFVIFTACNTNTSQQYYSEGAIGNFAKAFRYAGSKSVLTTSWEIDDKVNSFIIEKFIEYLSDGMPKNEALWLAKKDYWNQCEQDEEFKPLYWAPYVLTGNIDSVIIQKKEQLNFNWLWLLTLIPLAIIIWRKFN